MYHPDILLLLRQRGWDCSSNIKNSAALLRIVSSFFAIGIYPSLVLILRPASYNTIVTDRLNIVNYNLVFDALLHKHFPAKFTAENLIPAKKEF